MPEELIPIIDGHNDMLQYYYVPDKLPGYRFTHFSPGAHLDLPKALSGGFAGGFFAIFIPPLAGTIDSDVSAWRLQGYRMPPAAELPHAHAQQQSIAGIVSLLRLEKDPDANLIIARNVSDVVLALESKKISAIMHFEGAEAIDTGLNALEVFYQSGLRSLGITWSRPNAFAHGVPFLFPSSPDIGPGLTDAGRRLVRRCNELGIMLDLAHLNQKGFREVQQLSKAPLVVTHSAAHALCPSSRNLTDEQIDAIGASNGLIGITFYVGDLREDGQDNTDTPLECIVDHIDYIVDRIGIEHVAFGSDFDGAPIPRELGSAAGLPKLLDCMRERGYSEQDLRKMGHRNWIRVLYLTWAE